jgi:hypothetical protein
MTTPAFTTDTTQFDTFASTVLSHGPFRAAGFTADDGVRHAGVDVHRVDDVSVVICDLDDGAQAVTLTTHTVAGFATSVSFYSRKGGERMLAMLREALDAVYSTDRHSPVDPYNGGKCECGAEVEWTGSNDPNEGGDYADADGSIYCRL